ncbi:MAG TPA: protein kinase, partial [Polyangiales bacterium]|nr:protein kinase [Polyangiales bacterium]
AVYKVLDERTGTALALKRLQAPPGRHALFGTQFEREYHTLCQLAHPSIIEVYEYGIDEAGAFYTMELLEGPELRKLCPLPWQEACELLRDVASSLAVLHSRRLLHRDISVRNVRCTAAGRAKLLDFGAMAPMGPCKQTVGTPPFVPPEALQLQALDARADLYSLGALAYYALTARYPYPARTFRELQAAFAHPPPMLRTPVPDAPEALERLIAQLLRLDREVRPGTAADVMERLSGIAGLPLREHAEVTRAYLATPTLVGREPAQYHAAALLRATAQGGGCLLIEGEAGLGRSRMLDAAVLRAKLLGIAVLRGDAGDGAGRPYGLMRALCAQLFELLPEAALRQASLQEPVLAQVIDLPGRPPPPAEPAVERRHVHAALRDFVRALCRTHALAIAVDDVELVDEPSAALLAALCHGAAKRKLALLLTTRSSAAPVPALALIREVAEVIALAPLSASESEALLRSVFGDADHLPALAQRAHQLSGGNPRWLMTLAEHLVDHGVARYEAGSWSLPGVLPAHALPESLTAALQERVDEIPDSARELAQTLALTDPTALSPQQVAALLAHGDAGRGYAALDSLLSCGVLVSAGERLRFAQPELAELLRAGLAPERERALHARIAAALAGSDAFVRECHHLALAGQELQAIERAQILAGSHQLDFSQLMLSVFERLYLAAQRERVEPVARGLLRSGLVAAAALLGERERFETYAGPLLAELVQSSGLADYHALGELPAEQRLSVALTRAQQRHDSAPESERGLPPVEAIRQLARLCSTYVGLGAIVQDLRLFDPVPSLEPLCPLSPALGVVQGLVDGMLHMLAGRHDRTHAIYRGLLERIEQPDKAGLDPALHSTARLALLYLQGIFAAGMGLPDAPRWVSELVEKPGHRVNAYRVRMTTALMQGDLETAASCGRQADLLALQDGGQVPFPGSWERMVLSAHVHFDDVVGVKRAIERLTHTAALHPGRRPTLMLARGHYLRLQGDPAGALAVLLPTLSEVRVAQHPDWPWLAALHVQLLNALDRHAEAAELGGEYFASCVEHGIEPGHRYVAQHLIAALLELGRAQEALPLCERALREVEATGAQGCMLGLQYEARARVALALGDRAGFADYAEHCGREYQRGRNGALRARFDALMDQGRSSGLLPNLSRPPLRSDFARTGSAASTRDVSATQTAHERLAGCIGSAERNAMLAKLVLEATGGDAVLLFALYEGGLRLIAASPEQKPTRALVAALERYVRAQLAQEDTPTVVLAAGERAFELVGGGSFEP